MLRRCRYLRHAPTVHLPDLATGRSLTIHMALAQGRGRGRGPARVGRLLAVLLGPLLVDRHRTDRVVDRLPVGQLGLRQGRRRRANRARLRLLDPLDRARLRLLDPPDPAAQLVTGPGGRVDLAARVGRRQLGLGVRAGLVDQAVRVTLPANRVGLVVPAVQGLMGLVDRVDLAARVGLADRVVPVGRVGLVVPAVQGLMGLVDPVGRAALADRRRRRTHPKALTKAVAPNGVARIMRRTASAHPTMVRRLHRRSMDSAGTMGQLPEGLRLTGPGRRLRVDGMVRRLPAAGTSHGVGRRGTSSWRRPILGRSPTAATTPCRSSTRCSVDGVSGTSASGFRCTDPTYALPASGPPRRKSGAGRCRPSRELHAPGQARDTRHGRRDSPGSENNALTAIPVQDVRRDYVPGQGDRRHQSQRHSAGRGA
jgi:hypothetical protein